MQYSQRSVKRQDTFPLFIHPTHISPPAIIPSMFESRLSFGLKLVPTLPTGGIAEVIRSSIVGDIFRNLLPRHFALRRIGTVGQLANSLLEEPNLDTYQQRHTLLECRNLHRYQSILASLLEQPCASSKFGIGHGVLTLLRQNSPAGGCPCMTCQQASI